MQCDLSKLQEYLCHKLSGLKQQPFFSSGSEGHKSEPGMLKSRVDQAQFSSAGSLRNLLPHSLLMVGLDRQNSGACSCRTDIPISLPVVR